MPVTTIGGERRLRLAEPGAEVPWAGPARLQSPEDTLRSVLPLARLFGITRVADITGLDRIGIPVAIAVRPTARSVTVAQGKGLDLASAKVSALMEAIEVWHAEHIDRPLVLASIAELSDARRTCNVGRLPCVDGERRTTGARVLWIEGHDLVSDRPRFVPFEMVHADYSAPTKPGYGLFPASTNGLSSGNHPLEAICGAICELIERDAVAVWHQLSPRRRAATRLDLASIDDPGLQAPCRRIEDAGLVLGAWNVTSDVGVPAYLCLIHDPSERDSHIGLGSGAHPEAEVAFVRALTEAAQTRLTYISGSRDDLDPDEYTLRGRAQKRHLADRLLRVGPPVREFRSAPSFASATLQGNLDRLIAQLRACGIEEVVAVDLSRAEIGIAVCRAVIPGLEAPHDDPGYVPGPRARAAAGGATG